MPCDIGFKAYAEVDIPVPAPQTFSKRVAAPDIDADLLEKLGVSDPEYLAWASEVDVRALLEEALARVLKKGVPKRLSIELSSDGLLKLSGRFDAASQKALLRAQAGIISDRWQFELLGIVVELLGYTATISPKGNELTLEAEEMGKSHPCKYIRVTKGSGDADIAFEHFASREELALEMVKFEALARKLGVKVALRHAHISEGDAFSDATHEHSHDHPHDHTHKH